MTVSGTNPTGTVTFKNGAATLGTVTLTGSAASFTTASLAVGNHSIRATYNGNAQNPARTSSVLTQSVLGGSLPVVGITSPANNAVFTDPADIAIAGTATASGGRTIVDVVVMKNGSLLTPTGIGDLPNFAIGWSPIPQGTYVFTARATDNTGTSAISAPVTVRVVAPPTVGLTAPASGVLFTLPATVVLSAAAAPSSESTVTKVEFFQGATLLGTVTAAPFTLQWVNPPTGDYTVTAKVTDTNGLTATSSPIAISVRISAAGETITFLHTDVAGNPIAATNELGNTVWKEAYRPYGRRLRNEGPAAGNRQWFHGKAADAESGLQYFGARYYDPFLGRFYGVDPKGFDEGNIHSFNRYVYGNNNPFKYKDPDGRAASLILEAVVPVAIIGGVYYATRSRAEQQAMARSLKRAIDTIFNENANESGSGNTPARHGAGADNPEVPTELVGVQDKKSGQRGNRHVSGPLDPSRGGTGDAQQDFDKLTGGKSNPAPADSTYPPGTQIGENGIALRPGKGNTGPRIDIPANGAKPHETLHY